MAEKTYDCPKCNHKHTVRHVRQQPDEGEIIDHCKTCNSCTYKLPDLKGFLYGKS